MNYHFRKANLRKSDMGHLQQAATSRKKKKMYPNGKIGYPT
jgi:hypothetical protein